MTNVGKLSKFQKSAKVHPYVLDLENGTEVTFHKPNLRKLEELSQAQGPKDILQALLGDEFDKAYEVLGDLEVEQFEALLEEVMQSLGLSNGETEGNPTKR